MENNLRNLLEQLRLHHEAGNRHEFIAALRTLMDNRRDYFRQGMEETALLEGFADGLYKTLLLELDEEEEESIETAGVVGGGRIAEYLSPDQSTSAVLEALSASNYNTVLPAYFEIALKQIRKDIRTSLRIRCNYIFLLPFYSQTVFAHNACNSFTVDGATIHLT